MKGFMGLLIGFLLFDFTATLVAFENFQCCKIESACYQLEWETNQTDQPSYLFFASDNWEELMPLSPAATFLASPYAASTFLLSTENTSTLLNSTRSYLRIVALNKGFFVECERLIQLNSFPNLETPISKNEIYSAEITEKIWEKVTPYLLPPEHKLKKVMDRICNKSRILASTKALEKAGFKILVDRMQKGLIVASHPQLQGFLIKAYLDTYRRKEWSLWVLRAEGSQFVQKILDKHQWNQYFKVAEKWIYAVPKIGRPEADDNTFPKDFILLVKDLNLLNKEKSLLKYKNNMSEKRLKALYMLIDEGGLSDSHIDNIPFSSDGKIAFIDLEYYSNWPVHFDWLTPFFSEKRQAYWLELIKTLTEVAN